MLNCSTLILASLLLAATASQYCSSACIDYNNTCNTINFGDCTVCGVSVYNMVPNSTGCVLLSQTQVASTLIQVLEVDLTAPVSLSGFKSSSLAAFTCGSYQLSGQYGSGDYLQKQYQTPSAHYLVLLRFNVAFMGTWSAADFLLVSVDNVTNTLYYTCQSLTSECTATDCIRIREGNFTHISPTALVKFTSSSSQTKSVASWGLMNLMVVVKTCDPSCTSCFGPTNNQCYSCTSGYFLLGNACLTQCPLLAIPSINICAISCPNNYYKIQSTMMCEPCSMGCNTCSGPLDSDCIV